MPNATGYRLPTEAQWEYPCRAGTTTAYNTGEDTISDDTGWYTANSGRKTHEVGKKLPNAWGLYDMHGNVMELRWDRWGYYRNSPRKDPAGPSSGSERVLRGGGYASWASDVRSAYRRGSPPGSPDMECGFRLARPAQ